MGKAGQPNPNSLRPVCTRHASLLAMICTPCAARITAASQLIVRFLMQQWRRIRFSLGLERRGPVDGQAWARDSFLSSRLSDCVGWSQQFCRLRSAKAQWPSKIRPYLNRRRSPVCSPRPDVQTFHLSSVVGIQALQEVLSTQIVLVRCSVMCLESIQIVRASWKQTRRTLLHVATRLRM